MSEKDKDGENEVDVEVGSDSDDFDESENIDESTISSPRAKQSFMLRSKKFFASKTAQSKLGRKAIGHFLGEEGNKLLSTVKAAVKKDKGEKRAKEVKMLIVKMALKGKLLQDEGLIKKKDVWKIAEPLNTVALTFYACVRPPVAVKVATEDDAGTHKSQPARGRGNRGSILDRGRSVNVTQITSESQSVRDMCLGLFDGHVSESNLAKLRELFNYLCGVPFLDKFMNNPDMTEEKMVCFESLRRILANLIESRNFNDDMQQVCATEDCKDLVAVPYKDFAGSPWCARCHDLAYQKFVAQPTLDHFLHGDGKEYYPFQQQCKKDVERWIRKFYVTVVKYRTIAKPQIRPVFADEIFKKFVKPRAQFCVNLDPAMVTAIEADLKGGDPELFLAAEKACRVRLEAFFDKFVESEEFSEYKSKTYLLPAYAQTNLLDQKSGGKA